MTNRLYAQQWYCSFVYIDVHESKGLLDQWRTKGLPSYPWMNAPTPAPTACTPPVLNVWEKFIVPLGLLFLLICGLSASVDSKVFRSIVSNSNRGIFVGLFCQFLLMPFLGFVAVMTFIGKNNYPIGMTLLVVTSSPGGGFSKYADFCYISWHTS